MDRKYVFALIAAAIVVMASVSVCLCVQQSDQQADDANSQDGCITDHFRTDVANLKECAARMGIIWDEKRISDYRHFAEFEQKCAKEMTGLACFNGVMKFATSVVKYYEALEKSTESVRSDAATFEKDYGFPDKDMTLEQRKAYILKVEEIRDRLYVDRANIYKAIEGGLIIGGHMDDLYKEVQKELQSATDPAAKEKLQLVKDEMDRYVDHTANRWIFDCFVANHLGEKLKFFDYSIESFHRQYIDGKSVGWSPIIGAAEA